MIVQKSVSFFHDFIINISAFQIVQSRFKIFTLNSLRKFRVALFFERISKRSLFFFEGKKFLKESIFFRDRNINFSFFLLSNHVSSYWKYLVVNNHGIIKKFSMARLSAVLRSPKRFPFIRIREDERNVDPRAVWCREQAEVRREPRFGE